MALLSEDLNCFVCTRKSRRWFLNSRQILLVIEHALHQNLALRRPHVGERRRQQVRHVLLDERGVAGVRAGSLRGDVPERRRELIRLGDREQVLQKQRVELEPGFVEAVRHHREDLLHQGEVERLVELVAKLRHLEGLHHLQQEVEPSLRDVALGVP